MLVKLKKVMTNNFVNLVIEYIWGPAILAFVYFYLFLTKKFPDPSIFKIYWFLVCLFLVLTVFKMRSSLYAGELGKRVLDFTFLVLVTIFLFALKYKSTGLIGADGVISYRAEDCLYFSIVTWTTLGYGDFQPVEGARSWAAVEALAGYFVSAIYIGVFLLWASKDKAKS